ncbi:hypothetical protein E4U21_002473 [Claviceps maximensis]|nr:hypothetical protein E4U21_002473 [Claviceps maximensis]
MENRLIRAPITLPRRVLDCGFGAGHWAIDIAKQFPKSEVTGIDISPHMIPEDLPDNVDLQVDDLNLSFTFPSAHFDLVHSQMEDAHSLSMWSQCYHACLDRRKDPRAALRLEHRMIAAGFTDIQLDMIVLPMSPWATNEYIRKIGEVNLEHVPELLESLICYPMTQIAR